jgi:hypothetical protein
MTGAHYCTQLFADMGYCELFAHVGLKLQNCETTEKDFFKQMELESRWE